MELPGASADDEAFLDELFERAVRSRELGRELDLSALLLDREHLREHVLRMLELAREVTTVRSPAWRERPSIAVSGYELIEEVGRGSSGIVFRARQLALGREVALKVLSPALVASADARQRFVREAHALGRVRHPHVVAIHDVQVSPELCAYAMEWIGGGSLAQRLAASSAPLDPVEAARLGVALARALEALHGVGLVHRDVKPSNVLLRAAGVPALGDFGLVRDAEQSALTGSGEFLGTPAYASPEQLRGDNVAVGPWSDVYSLGVTLYVALSGKNPFGGAPSSSAMLRRIESGTAEPLAKANPRVPRDLATVIEKAMDPDPAHRYATAREFAEDLERLLRLEPVLARPAGFLRRFQRWMERSPQLALALLALLISLSLGAAISIALAFDLAQQAVELRAAAEREALLRREAEEQGSRARREAARANAEAAQQRGLVDFFWNVLTQGNPAYANGVRERTVAEAVQIASRLVLNDPKDLSPELEFEIHEIAIEHLLQVGLAQEIEPHLARYAELRERLCTPLEARAATADYWIGRQRRLLGATRAARCHFERALEIRRAAWSEDPQQIGRVLVSLGHTQRQLGELDAAAAAHAEAAFHFVRAGRDGLENLHVALTSLGKIELLRGELARAEELAGAALERATLVLPVLEHTDLAHALFLWGQVRWARGDEERGESLMAQGLEMQRATSGLEQNQSAAFALQLGTLLLERGRAAEAEAQFEAAFAARKVFSAEVAIDLGERYLALRRPERAVELLEARDEPSAEARARGRRWLLLGTAHARLGAVDNAREDLRRAQELLAEDVGAEELASRAAAELAALERGAGG
ncbi:MAG: serine/threonine protein kinase [Planctomycetes bacterium]|nr:serine/threonine protein kinase [Planctomycetota bacterium]